MTATRSLRGLAVATIAVLAAYRLTPPLARLDDAYISLHSARVVLSGHDPVYGVPALVGVTSPAYVALLTAILAAGITNGDTALRVANALGIVAFAASVWSLGGAIGLSFVRRAVLVIVAIASGILVLFNLTNGLETGWAMATLTFAIGSAHGGRAIPAACAAGLLPFLRPDLTPAAAMIVWYSGRGRSLAERVGIVSMAAAMALPWLLWMRIDTGTWITNTIRAKQLFTAEGCRPWTDKARTVMHASAVGLAQLFPLALGIVALARDKLGRVGLLAMVLSAIAYFVAYPGALETPFFRYLTAICVPWLCLGFAIGLARVPSFLAATLAITVMAVQFGFAHDQTAGFSAEVKATAEWIDRNLPATAVLLVHDAGGISEFGHRRAVDLVGLKTPSSISAHEKWTWPSCVVERGAAVSYIARTSGADYFVALTGWDEYLRPDLIAHGFVLTPVRTPPEGRPRYTVYRMEYEP